MNESIVELGYRPSIVQSRIDPQSTRPGSGSSTTIPEPVASAINTAAETGKFVFVEFYAEWCGACKTLERTTLTDPAVNTALGQFDVLKVDTDVYADAARHFNVVGMPTLLVLDGSGAEVYRQTGMIGATALTRDLSALLSGSVPARPVASSNVPATPPSRGPRDAYQVHVSGLACPFCVYGLERSIGAISGVDSVAVDLKSGRVRISMHDGEKLDETRVRDAIADAGFNVDAFEPMSPGDRHAD